MDTDEIRRLLAANVGKRVTVEFDDGITHLVEVGSVDEEGFLHSGPEGRDPRDFWTRFESVRSVQQDSSAK